MPRPFVTPAGTVPAALLVMALSTATLCGVLLPGCGEPATAAPPPNLDAVQSSLDQLTEKVSDLGDAVRDRAPDMADLAEQTTRLRQSLTELEGAVADRTTAAANLEEDGPAEARLRELAAATADPDGKPSADQLAVWEGELNETRADLSPLAEARLLPIANAVAWNLAARRLESGTAGADWLAEVDTLQTLAPDRVPPASRERLERVRTGNLKTWIPTLLAHSEPDPADLEAALDAFPPGEHAWEKQLTAALEQIDARETAAAKVAQAKADAAELSNKLAAVHTLPTDLRRSGLVRLSGAVEGRYLEWRIDREVAASTLQAAGWDDLRTAVTAAVEREGEAAAKQQRDHADKARRAYQAWALGQIEIARRTVKLGDAQLRIEEWFGKMKDRPKARTWDDLARFPRARNYVNEQAKTKVGDDGSISIEDQLKIFKAAGGESLTGSWQIAPHLARLINHDTFRDFLLPIDERLLDPPVARFYHKAFDEGWASLDGHPDWQLEVAKATAEVPKKSLSDFLPD